MLLIFVQKIGNIETESLILFCSFTHYSTPNFTLYFIPKYTNNSHNRYIRGWNWGL